MKLVEIGEVLNLFRCPDDHSNVLLNNNGWLECVSCKRRYKIFNDKLFEMLPSEFPEWDLRQDEPQKAQDFYRAEFSRKSPENNGRPWGDLVKAGPGVRGFYNSEMQKVVDLLKPKFDTKLIDVSGTVGNYALYLSDKVQTIINCDLHLASILLANERKTGNMICVRSAYLNLPFVSDTFDYAICTDTLARGWNHEIKLIKEICRVLKIEGKAFVDFHNHKWYARNNNIMEYKLGEIEILLSESGVKQYDIYPFGYVPSKLVPTISVYKILDKLCKLFLPCKRYIVVLTKARSSV